MRNKIAIFSLFLALSVSGVAAQSNSDFRDVYDPDDNGLIDNKAEFENNLDKTENTTISNDSVVFDKSKTGLISGYKLSLSNVGNLTIQADKSNSASLEAQILAYDKDGNKINTEVFSIVNGSNTFNLSDVQDATKYELQFEKTSNAGNKAEIDSIGLNGKFSSVVSGTVNRISGLSNQAVFALAIALLGIFGIAVSRY